LMLGGHSADDHSVVAVLNTFQLGNTSQIDKVLGHRQPELHHRDQALPASEHACVFAILRKECGCLRERLGAVVGEWGVLALNRTFAPTPDRTCNKRTKEGWSQERSGTILLRWLSIQPT